MVWQGKSKKRREKRLPKIQWREILVDHELSPIPLSQIADALQDPSHENEDSEENSRDCKSELGEFISDPLT